MHNEIIPYVDIGTTYSYIQFEIISNVTIK